MIESLPSLDYNYSFWKKANPSSACGRAHTRRYFTLLSGTMSVYVLSFVLAPLSHVYKRRCRQKWGRRGSLKSHSGLTVLEECEAWQSGKHTQYSMTAHVTTRAFMPASPIHRSLLCLCKLISGDVSTTSTRWTSRPEGSSTGSPAPRWTELPDWDGLEVKADKAGETSVLLLCYYQVQLSNKVKYKRWLTTLQAIHTAQHSHSHSRRKTTRKEMSQT